MNTALDIEKNGSLLFEKNSIPFTNAEWHRLEKLIRNSDYEHIIGGDANESHSVWVARYVNDIKQPEMLNETAKAIQELVMSEKMRRFYSAFTGTEQLCLRRCQANKMYQGDYIGMHKDQDSNPDYFATVIFHLESLYQGGIFETSDKRRYRPEPHMALVNNCAISHQVTPVTEGERLTLACFLSTSFSESRHKRHAFVVEKPNKS